MRCRIARFAVGLLITGASASRSLAEDSQFDGAWVLIGAKSSKDMSKSEVTYDYTNLFAGSLQSPGYQESSKYELGRSGSELIPSFSAGYTVANRELFYGFALSAERVGAWKLKSGELDFATPTAGLERPIGFATTTEIESGYDLGFSFQPGLQTSSISLTYLKLSYHMMQSTVTTRSSLESGLSNPVFTETSSERTWKGLGIGLGTRFMFADTLMVDLLFDYVSYLTKRVSAPSMTSSVDEVTLTQAQLITLRRMGFSASLGYRF